MKSDCSFMKSNWCDTVPSTTAWCVLSALPVFVTLLSSCRRETGIRMRQISALCRYVSKTLKRLNKKHRAMRSNKSATMQRLYSEVVEQFKHWLNKQGINICTPLIFHFGRANLYVSVIIYWYVGSAISLEMQREDTLGREENVIVRRQVGWWGV
jgi:hypothetical protein